jgi:glycosyltransferase involved in cell wall biosynthesis
MAVRFAQTGDEAGVSSPVLYVGKGEKRVKVLFLTGCTGRGGAGNSLFYLLKHLDPSVIEPLVVMPNEGVLKSKLVENRIRYRIEPRLKERLAEMRYRSQTRVCRIASVVLNAIDSVRFTFDLIRMVSRERVALIYCNQMMVKLMGTVAGMACGTPVVWHCRTLYGKSFRGWFFDRLARSSTVTRIVAVSEACAGNFPSAEDKVRVVYNGADLVSFDPERVRGCVRRMYRIGPDEVVLGFVGRIVAWKGIDTLLSAMEHVLARRKDVVLVVVGGSPQRSLNLLDHYRRKVANGRYSGRVVFTGFRTDVRPYLKDMDVTLVPSVAPDPCPRSVIESLALGTPVVGSAIGGVPELIRDGYNGFLVKPNDDVGLAETILRVIENRELRQRMGSAARVSAVQRHDAVEVARRVQTIMFEALGL